jgi:chromate transporter
MGTLGLLATAFYTFLPCFFFVFAGAPLMERTQGKRTIEGILLLITAVVVGAILDLAFFQGKAVILSSEVVGLKQINPLSLGWVMLSLLLLQRFKLKIIPLILLGVGFGLTRRFLGL